MKNIQMYARRTELLSKLLIPTTFIFFILKWSNNLADLSPSTIPDMPTLHRIAGFCVSMILASLITWALIVVIKLMQQFYTKEVFSTTSSALLAKLSKIILALVMYMPINNSLLSIITTWHYPIGQRTLTIAFGTDDVINIILFSIVALLASVVHEGYRLKSENELTI